MKNKFSTKWISSKQPRKQRKYKANAPLHIRKKIMGCNLSKALREKYGKRSIGIRKGDEVKILRGQFALKKGKISLVDLKKLRVAVDGVQRQKKDGSKINVWLNTSSLQIQELNLDDKKRLAALNRKAATKEEGEKSKTENKVKEIKETKESKK
jgi:large subunit ribosomal protein L24